MHSLFASNRSTEQSLVAQQQQVLQRLLQLLIPAMIFFGIIAGVTGIGKSKLLLVILATVIIGFLGIVYLLNRRGNVALATTFLLSSLAAADIIFILIDKTLTPQLYILIPLIVIAAAFGTPRSPLYWALGFTPLPFLMSAVINGSLFAPNKIYRNASGLANGSLFSQQIAVVLLYWIVGAAAYLTAQLLHQALSKSQAATHEVVQAHQELTTQQDLLSEKNSELQQTQQHLEAMVQALTVPVIPIAKKVGLLALVGPIDNQRMVDVERTTLALCFQQGMHALIIDTSGSSTMDAESIEALNRLVSVLKLIGVHTMIAGISAANARTIGLYSSVFPSSVATVQEALAVLSSNSKG